MDRQITIVLTNGISDYHLIFELCNSSIAKKWYIELLEFIQAGQPFDDRERFYNFPYSKFTENYVVDHLNQLIDTVNSYSPIITKRAELQMSQETLNYLHHIFEVYHGLYDEQSLNDFFYNAPINVQRALGDLNIWIHRYETLGDIPRFVGTWYGKPSRKPLVDEDFQEFSLVEHWGDLCINYCEVGKTLYDLYHDNDQYIDPKAFKPLHYYSVDFTVRFTNHSEDYYKKQINNIWQYYDRHSDFFKAQGYRKFDSKLSLGSIVVGKIANISDKKTIIDAIGKHQYIKEIIC